MRDALGVHKLIVASVLSDPRGRPHSPSALFGWAPSLASSGAQSSYPRASAVHGIAMIALSSVFIRQTRAHSAIHFRRHDTHNRTSSSWHPTQHPRPGPRLFPTRFVRNLSVNAPARRRRRKPIQREYCTQRDRTLC